MGYKRCVLAIFLSFLLCMPAAFGTKLWELQELTFKASRDYENAYTEVQMWVDLVGPGGSKRINGFWDGGRIFKVRVAATAPGTWHWQSGSNQPSDKGLKGKTGSFEAVMWTEAEKAENPNRRGIIRPTKNGHALEYADGTPFFLSGDTWWAATTWRLPFKGKKPAADYEPGPGIGFEELVSVLKRRGYNSMNMIACYPNWALDEHANGYSDKNEVKVRQAWQKWGCFTDKGQLKCKDMHDELGNRPFALLKDGEGVADFDRINPGYFQSLDRKMRYLSEQGFAPMLEPIRRDTAPSWAAYFDFNTTYARYLTYLVARYGAHNMVFSGIHLDAIPQDASLTAKEFNNALIYFVKTHGPLPYGQPFTTLISWTTQRQFGHGEQCPWLTMHSAGNRNARNHGITPELEAMFKLETPYPIINLEPYYTGWEVRGNSPAGERPPVNSERDNYFARASMYSCVLSGALSGHVHGTAGYDCTTTGEPAGERPYIWEALNYDSGKYMRHLRTFVLSEGKRFQKLMLATDDLAPRKASDSKDTGLDGWSYMMRTPEKDMALLYFEHKAPRGVLNGMIPDATYKLQWFAPRDGEWDAPVRVKADQVGKLAMPPFPKKKDQTFIDWAAKLTL